MVSAFLSETFCWQLAQERLPKMHSADAPLGGRADSFFLSSGQSVEWRLGGVINQLHARLAEPWAISSTRPMPGSGRLSTNCATGITCADFPFGNATISPLGSPVVERRMRSASAAFFGPNTSPAHCLIGIRGSVETERRSRREAQLLPPTCVFPHFDYILIELIVGDKNVH